MLWEVIARDKSCATKGLLTQLEVFLCGKRSAEFLWFSDATIDHMRGKSQGSATTRGFRFGIPCGTQCVDMARKRDPSTSRQSSAEVFDVGDPETIFMEMITFSCHRLQHCASAESELSYIAYPLIHPI